MVAHLVKDTVNETQEVLTWCGGDEDKSTMTFSQYDTTCEACWEEATRTTRATEAASVVIARWNLAVTDRALLHRARTVALAVIEAYKKPIAR
jgi:hypothetical protein